MNKRAWLIFTPATLLCTALVATSILFSQPDLMVRYLGVTYRPVTVSAPGPSRLEALLAEIGVVVIVATTVWVLTGRKKT